MAPVHIAMQVGVQAQGGATTLEPQHWGYEAFLNAMARK